MTSTRRGVSLHSGVLVSLALVACTREPVGRPVTASASASGASASASSVRWPTPASWKSETIPFPLPFAPQLAYRGVEELRFAPHFFDAKAETYFSYSFAWLLEDAAVTGQQKPPMAIASDRLAADLGSYFAGLARAVDEAHFDASAHGARLEPSGERDGRYRGVVRTVDAFGDGRALALNVDGESFVCGTRRVLILSLSPQPVGHPTWSALAAQRATFKCGGGA